ncbi:MAG: serine/threonine protein kinase, partial [Planctomycetota bacterium]|nr:serine/threonine protein kinase [Planctomycetota bacterium]
MPSQDDLLFGSLCASMKFARPEMVTECLKVQADEEGTGQRRGLGEIMISRGYLTSEQLAQVLEAQGRSGRARTMGPYELTGKLGQGGMGTVFKARLRGTQIDVALKILPDRMVLNESFLVRFKREATLGKELLHPNIVRTLDFGNDRGVNYIALELVEGGDLDGKLKKAGKLPEREALGVVRDVAKGLMHAHERGLIHRDIKPSNIMFDRAGTVKLSDFGLVKDTNPEASSLTQTGAMMGTPYYLAPEQAQGAKDLDIRADIYSLGATLYHCVTGRPPHEGETPYEVVVKHITEALTPPDQVNSALSAGCCRIVKKMMAKDKLHRHASPAEVVEDIERHLRGLQVAEARHAVTARPPAQGRDARPARRPEREARAKKDGPPMIFLGAAAGVLLLGLLGVVLLGGTRPPADAAARL